MKNIKCESRKKKKEKQLKNFTGELKLIVWVIC